MNEKIYKSEVIKNEMAKITRVMMSKADFKIKYGVIFGAMIRVFDKGKTAGESKEQ